MTICGQTCLTPTPTQAHCPTCHETFGGITGFDAHRKGGECLDPELKGYVETKGIWRLPIDEARAAQLASLRVSATSPDGLERVLGSSHPPKINNPDLTPIGAPVGSAAAFLAAIREAP